MDRIGSRGRGQRTPAFARDANTEDLIAVQADRGNVVEPGDNKERHHGGEDPLVPGRPASPTRGNRRNGLDFRRIRNFLSCGRQKRLASVTTRSVCGIREILLSRNRPLFVKLTGCVTLETCPKDRTSTATSACRCRSTSHSPTACR